MIKQIFYYGLIIALIILLIKGADYSVLSQHISKDIYTSLLLILFTGLGIWFGLKLTNPKVVIKERVIEKIDPDKLKKHGISDREMEILTLIAAGHTNQQIADQLFISLSTVKSHIQKIYQKLDVKNRTQAIKSAKSLSA